MSKLWSKAGHEKPVNTFLETFTAGKDPELDLRLVKYDVLGSRVHARGLQRIGVFSAEELTLVEEAFDQLDLMIEKGEFKISVEQEDMHTAIEQFLIEKLGATGKKIHTGRSRNDQVLTALRMFEKDRLLELKALCLILSERLLQKAKKYEMVAMPGYSHNQRAMISSVGMWLGAYTENLLYAISTIEDTYAGIDYCPLGTAAGYGVNLDLDRIFLAKELGFREPVVVSLAAQNSRLKSEILILSALKMVGLNLAQLAGDILHFTSREFDFLSFDPALHTGSSIMPQKQNLDVAELIRGSLADIAGEESKLTILATKLTSGYHRDMQLGKEPVIRAFDTTEAMIEASILLIASIEPKVENLRKACTKELLAADQANDLVKEGVPFREAYQQIGQSIDFGKIAKDDLADILRSRTHLGATGNLGLDQLSKKIEAFKVG
jgi:argininosuccinate lyase